MKKILISLVLAIWIRSPGFAYSPTIQDQEAVSTIESKLTVALTKVPQNRVPRTNQLELLKFKYKTNERVLWFLNEFITFMNSFWASTTSSWSSSQSSWSQQTNTSPQGNCTIFPSNNPRNTDISSYPVHSNSANYITSIGSSKFLHPDFGANRNGGPFGIPYVIVGNSTPKVPVKAIRYPEESDEGNFPVPLNAPKENGDDAHVIAVDMDNCMLYELYAAEKSYDWRNAGSVAKFDMKSNTLRPDWRTSADAAWLPIYPGLVRYDEVANGQINHALRFTISKSQKAYIAPATHFASSSIDSNLPPMGLRLRLKASYDTSRLTGQSKIIAQALKKYGMIVADNGSDRYISWAPDTRRNDEDLNQLKGIPWSAFEVVDTGPIKK